MVEPHSVTGPAVVADEPQVDLDDQAADFELSPASAEQVTIQIRSLMERAWEYIAMAYQGRAHLALGYTSWDEYVDDRRGELRLTVPREQRGAVVQSLSKAQMSLRRSRRFSAAAWQPPTATCRRVRPTAPIRTSARRSR